MDYCEGLIKINKMKRMFLFLPLLILLNACSVKIPDLISFGQNKKPAAVRENDSLLIYIPYVSGDDGAYWERASFIARVSGFNIYFKTIPYGESQASFSDTVGSNPSGVFLPRYDERSYFMNFYPNWDSLKNGAAGDVYEAAANVSPEYLSYSRDFNDPGKMFFMPVNFLGYTNCVGALIKTDANLEYESELMNLNDLENLLRAMKENDYAVVPCAGVS